MCLHTVQLNTSIIDGRVIGTGYKQMASHVVSDYGDAWIKAEGKLYGNSKLESKIISVDRIAYHPGFHIFVNQIDAERYTGAVNGIHPVYQVEFRDIMALGENECYYDPNHKEDSGWVLKPCVVAKWMRVVKKVS